MWTFLSTEAYWGRERSRELVERQIREASRVVGLYRGGSQVGFARTWTEDEVHELVRGSGALVWTSAKYRQPTGPGAHRKSSVPRDLRLDQRVATVRHRGGC